MRKKPYENRRIEAGQIDLQRDFVCGMMLLGVSPAWLLAGVKPKLIPGHPTMMDKERDKAYIRIGRSVDKYFASIEKKGLAGNVKPYVKWPGAVRLRSWPTWGNSEGVGLHFWKW